MPAFFRAQTDYLLLLSCISFLVLGSACLVPGRFGRTRMPWAWLGLFGFVHCFAELLNLLALDLCDTPLFALIRPLVEIVSFAILLEFGRASSVAVRGKGPGRWLLIPFLGMAFIGSLWGVGGLERISLLVLGVSASAWITVALIMEARSLTGLARWSLVTTAVALSAHTAGHSYLVPIAHTCLAVCTAVSVVVNVNATSRSKPGADFGASIVAWPALVLVLLLGAGWWVAEILGVQTDQRMRSDLLARTIIAATVINPVDVEALDGVPADISKSQFARVKMQLKEIHRSHPDCRFVYVTGLRRGKIVFLVDAEPEDSEDYSPPGQVYDEATDTFTRCCETNHPFIEGPVTDRWGTWVSGAASIRYPYTNKVVGMIGLDVDSANWPKAVARIRLVCMLVTLLLCALAVTLSYALHSSREFGSYLAVSEKRYRTLVESSPNVVELFDADGKYLTINQAGQSILGYTQDELVGRDYVGLWPQATRGTVEENVRLVLAGEKSTFEAEYIRPDGRPVQLYVMLSPVAGDGDRVQRFIGISVDITALKHIQSELAEEKERLGTTLRSIGDGVIATDNDGTVVLVNKAAEMLTGWNEADAVGRPLDEVFHIVDERTGDRKRSLVESVLENGETIELSGHTSLVARDGAVRSIADSGAPILDRQGRVSGVVIAFRDVTEKRVYGEKLNYLAHHDPLTGLPNRMLFGDRLAQGLANANRFGHKLAVMFVDLDHFKYINDTLGHNTGDELLQEVAKRLSSCMRDSDTLARMGGDEFTIILNNIADSHASVLAAERVLEVLSAPVFLDGQEFFVSASIGISIYPTHGADAETLVKNADTAMYRAKEKGRDGYFLYTEALNTAAVERMTLENSLRKALERDELSIYYQPQVSISSGVPVGVEALARWHNPELGYIPPNQFIPLAEETGLIIPISEWVLRTACSQAVAWDRDGHGPMLIGVNVSARQFQQSDLAGLVRRVLSETGLDPTRLNLEITESLLMRDPENATQTLFKLRDMGVKISLDDFGTGYSSLSYLKRFPIDVVKIDQSFVRDITQDSDDAAIAGAVIAMAHSLKLSVVAEGVETLEQLEFLRELECDEIQGYFVSPPVPAAELGSLLTDALPRAA